MQIVLAYIGVVLIWSTTPLGITYSVDSLNFIQASALRMWASLFLCFLLLKMWRIPFSTSRAALMGYVAGAVGVLGAMLCVYWAGGKVPSGLIAVIWGLTPMAVSLFSLWLIKGHRLSWAKFAGMLIAVTGLFLVFSGQINVAFSMVAGLAVLMVGVALHAYSSVLLQKQQSDVHPLTQTTGALAVSAPGYLLVWLLVGGELPEVVTMKSLIGTAYLTVMGSIVGFVGYFYLLKHLSAAAVSLTTLITPVLALMLGALINHERLPLETWFGAGVIMAALVVYNHAAILKLLPKVREAVSAKGK